MTYNERLNKLSSGMKTASAKVKTTQQTPKAIEKPTEETTSTMLNKIGLEVQRQGGH